ncbi:MAG: hypothetical protein QW808_02145, partial [Desulfurococcaceae archaeon]
MRVNAFGKDLLVGILITMVVFQAYQLTYITTASNSHVFQVIGAVWGTTSSPVCVGPGASQQRLTLLLKYTGSEPLFGIKAMILLPQHIKDALSKSNSALVTYAQLIAPN